MTYCVDVITADASRLKNRGLAYAFTSSPYMITAFAGSKASAGFYYNVSWRWGFGCFAIIFPIAAAPLFLILKYYLRKAEKQRIVRRVRSGRSFLQNIWYYCQEFDGTSKAAEAPNPHHIKQVLIGISAWGHSVFYWPHHLLPAVRHRQFCSQWLVIRLYHCNAGGWSVHACHLHHL